MTKFDTQPLPPMSLEELDEFLISDATPDDTLTLPELDGFLTAVVIGPEMIMPGEWLRVVWGGGTPEFASEDEAQRVLDAIMGRYNDIVATLADDPESFHPIMWENPLSGEAMAADWVEGFMDGVQLRPEGWREFLDSEDGRYFTPIAAFLSDDEDLPPAVGSDPESRRIRRTSTELIPTSVSAIYRYFRGRRSRPRRRKVGRNDPCPCGSGRKYKRCCGAN